MCTVGTPRAGIEVSIYATITFGCYPAVSNRYIGGIASLHHSRLFSYGKRFCCREVDGLVASLHFFV